MQEGVRTPSHALRLYGPFVCRRAPHACLGGPRHRASVLWCSGQPRTCARHAGFIEYLYRPIEVSDDVHGA